MIQGEDNISWQRGYERVPPYIPQKYKRLTYHIHYYPRPRHHRPHYSYITLDHKPFYPVRPYWSSDHFLQRTLYSTSSTSFCHDYSEATTPKYSPRHIFLFPPMPCTFHTPLHLYWTTIIPLLLSSHHYFRPIHHSPHHHQTPHSLNTLLSDAVNISTQYR